jgi:putative PIG3 family NAD(P)H quinone oxidoreductase
VLIHVLAAGVNRADLMQREGRYPPPPGASDIPGLEIAGEVVAVGAQVTTPNLGDRVCALLTGGGYAEYCVASAGLCRRIPDDLTPVQAASLPEALFTVWDNVFDRGHLRAAERLLVHGGTSGIGVYAIQCARALGATVYATAGSEEKCRACADLGAEAIDYRRQDFVQEITRMTGGQGVDVVLDMVGGDYLQRNLDCLAVGGRLVQIAVQQGPKGVINLLTVMQKRLTLTGSTLRSRPDKDKERIARTLESRIWPLIDNGRIRPVVHRCFPLDQAADAHRLMEAGTHIGKIVLAVGAA